MLSHGAWHCKSLQKGSAHSANTLSASKHGSECARCAAACQRKTAFNSTGSKQIDQLLLRGNHRPSVPSAKSTGGG